MREGKISDEDLWKIKYLNDFIKWASENQQSIVADNYNVVKVTDKEIDDASASIEGLLNFGSKHFDFLKIGLDDGIYGTAIFSTLGSVYDSN